MTTRRQTLTLLASLPVFAVAGCDGDANGTADACQPTTLTDEDECTLCGMTIVNFPGPKGQACLRDGALLPFCSTGDLFSWAWQPESAASVVALYVHNLSRTSWDEPSDAHFMDAEEAWYVAGHDQKGAMGEALAPFSVREDAQAFAEAHGGSIFHHDELDWPHLHGDLADGDPSATRAVI